VLPADLPAVDIPGIPSRYGPQRAYWEWLRVSLPTGGEIAVFDPDHLCPPGWFGQPCRLGVELFHPSIRANPNQEQYLRPLSPQADTEAPPTVAGQVIAQHHDDWLYTGPVTTWQELAGTRQPQVHHVLNAPQTTARLVVSLGDMTLLAQLRDPAEAPPIGQWVILSAGRPELVTITRQIESEAQ
jgi:hypothetical protein